MKADTVGLRSPWMSRAPLIGAALLVLLVNGVNIARSFASPNPHDPWEAAETVEGWRSAHGIPVYESAPDGHAAPMYGPLAPWAIGEMFRFAGTNNQAGRLLTLLGAVGTAILLVLIVGGRRALWFQLVAFALFMGLNWRTGDYFVVNRPDMLAMLFAAMGVLLLGRGHERQSVSSVLLGTACVVAGFFFMQSAAIFAVVPLVVLGLKWQRPSIEQVLLAALPLAVVLAIIPIMRIADPAMYFGMIIVPRSFGLNHLGTVRAAMDLLLDYPLFVLVAADWLMDDARAYRKDHRVLWVLAALVVAVPFSAMMSVRLGGARQSLLPALLTMTAFVVLRLPRLSAILEDCNAHPMRRLAFGSFLGALLLLGLFPHPSRKHGFINARNPLADSYRRVIARTAELPGTVVSPEDPTIVLYAKGQAVRNLFTEYDAHTVNGEWPKQPPWDALNEMRHADYLIDVRGYGQDLLVDSMIEPLGFEPVDDPAFDDVNYRLWRKRSGGKEGLVSTH